MSERKETVSGGVQTQKEVGSRRRKTTPLNLERGMEMVHEQWWQMVEQSPSPIFLVSADRGTLLESNPRCEEVLGWSREELRGMGMISLASEDAWDQVGKLVDDILGEGVGVIQGARLRQRDGQVLSCELQGHLVLFHQREAIQFSIRTHAEERPSGISGKTATFFHDLSQIIPLLLDFDQILDRILERFAMALEFHAFALSLVEGGELKRLTLYTSEEPLEGFLSEVQEHVLGALLHLGVQVNPTHLQYSIRERGWICGSRYPIIGSELILPIPLGGAQGVQGVGGLFHQGSHAFSSEETGLFSTFVGGIASSYLVYHSYRQIEAQSYTDPMTGLANRRGLFRELEKLMDLARREMQPISLVLLDIDHFKEINDRYGHKAGDEVLQHLANYLQHGIREMDVVARFGGEEFLVLLPRIDLETAREIAERIRADVASIEFQVSAELRSKVPHGPIRITVSLGIGAVRPGEDPDLVIRRVDEALYRAKGGGRNRVAVESWS